MQWTQKEVLEGESAKTAVEDSEQHPVLNVSSSYCLNLILRQSQQHDYFLHSSLLPEFLLVLSLIHI